jgi:hypothetical protein
MRALPPQRRLYETLGMRRASSRLETNLGKLVKKRCPSVEHALMIRDDEVGAVGGDRGRARDLQTQAGDAERRHDRGAHAGDGVVVRAFAERLGDPLHQLEDQQDEPEERQEERGGPPIEDAPHRAARCRKARVDSSAD